MILTKQHSAGFLVFIHKQYYDARRAVYDFAIPDQRNSVEICSPQWYIYKSEMKSQEIIYLLK